MRTPIIALVASAATLLCPASLPAQWQPQTSGTTAELRGLSVPAPGVVWASGTRGRYVRTTDGGRRWMVDSVAGAGTLDLRAVQALDARRAWVMSAGEAQQGQARMYATSDAGAHWALVFDTTLTGVFLDAIAFWDARHGIALSDPVNGQLFLLTTDDGGRRWTRVPPEHLPPTLPGEAAFAASGSCLTIQGRGNAWIGTGGGARARVFRSTDRGRSWRVADTPVHAGGASSGIFSVAFRDARHGIVVGGDYQQPAARLHNVALTDDGGATWRLARGPFPAGYMSAVAYVQNAPRISDAVATRAAPRVVAVGLAGTALSRDGGESWSMVDTVAYNGVAFVSAVEGWAVGPRGKVARWRGRP